MVNGNLMKNGNLIQPLVELNLRYFRCTFLPRGVLLNNWPEKYGWMLVSVKNSISGTFLGVLANSVEYVWTAPSKNYTVIFTIFCYFYREKLERLENVDEMENPGQEEPWDKEDHQDQEEIPDKEVTQDFQEMTANQEQQVHQ